MRITQYRPTLDEPHQYDISSDNEPEDHMAYEVTLPDVKPPQASGSSTEGATPLTPHQETLPQLELETEEKAPKDTVWV